MENKVNAMATNSEEFEMKNLSAELNETKQSKAKKFFASTPDYIDILAIERVFNPCSPWPRKLLWGIMIGIGVAFALYQISSQIIYFYTWPVSVSVNISDVSELPFPRVTICNYNGVTVSSTWSVGGNNQDSFMDIFQNGVSGGYYDNWENFYEYHSHKLDEMILSCSWNGQPCYHTNFTKVYSDMGICYSFNAGQPPVTTRQSNEDFGLRLLLHTQNHEYLYTENGSKLMSSICTGFKILINPQYEPVHVRAHGLSLLVGVQNQVAISKVSIKSLSAPWENCRSEPLEFYKTYSHKACNEECQMNHMVDKCGCRFIYMPSDKPVCSPEEEQSCAKGVLESIHGNLSKVCNCPIACHKDEYPAALSHAYLSNSFLQLLAESLGNTTEYWRENAIFLNVYYKDMVEEISSHQPVYTNLSLLCDIGGAVGLLLGTSVLVVLEFIDMLLMHVLGYA